MSQLVTQANAAFVDEDYQKAEQLFAEVNLKGLTDYALKISAHEHIHAPRPFLINPCSLHARYLLIRLQSRHELGCLKH